MHFSTRMMVYSVLAFMLAIASCSNGAERYLKDGGVPNSKEDGWLKVGDYVSDPNSPVGALVFDGPMAGLEILSNGVSVWSPLTIEPHMTEAEIADTVFDFVKHNFIPWNTKAILGKCGFLYGTGFGLCGEESAVMAALWRVYGLESRTISWSKHVVAEVKVDGVWRLYDAQHKTDFSEVNGFPTSFNDLQAGTASPQMPVDAIHYGHEYIRTLYEEAKVKRSSGDTEIPLPKFELLEGDSLVIRPRPSKSKMELPISDVPHTITRSHILPIYEVEFVLRAGEAKREIVLETGLPLINVDLKGEDSVKAKASYWTGGKRMDAATFIEKWGGRVEKFEIELEAGDEISLTYSLAGWLGNRIFRPRVGNRIDFLSKASATLFVIPKKDLSAIRIENLEVLGDFMDEDSIQVSVSLSWENMFDAAPRSYRIHLDELSSGLPLEVWRFLGKREWTWQPDTMPASGQTTLHFSWDDRDVGSPYRPDHYRNLLARIVGPGVDAGRNFKMLDLRVGK